MTRLRRALCGLLVGGLVGACTDGPGPTQGTGAIPLDIVPRFQLDPSPFTSSPVDGVRMVATDVVTSRRVGSLDRALDPNASRWVLDVAVDLGDDAFLDVLVEIELLAGSTVEWSGRAGPFRVPTAPNTSYTVDVYRGPLSNLDVATLAILGAPAQLTPGATRALTAQLTLLPGAASTPVVFWASSNPAVATVTPQGTTATLTAVGPGTADIIAAAGAAFDEVTVPVSTLPVGAPRTWVGGDADDPTGWQNPDNWSPAGVPSAGDAVVVSGGSVNPVLGAPAAVWSIPGQPPLNGFRVGTNVQVGWP